MRRRWKIHHLRAPHGTVAAIIERPVMSSAVDDCPPPRLPNGTQVQAR